MITFHLLLLLIVDGLTFFLIYSNNIIILHYITYRLNNHFSSTALE